MTDLQFRELAVFETSAAFSELEKLVMRYALSMSMTPVEVPVAPFAALKEHLDPREMVELTPAIAWENYRARFVHAFGVESAGFSEAALCPLPFSVG